MATTLMLSILVMLLSIPNFSLSCPLYQKQALLDFKHSLTDSFFKDYELGSWNPDSDCCTWDLVKCDITMNVTELHLELANSIPVSSNILTPLFHIQSLKTLDISDNSLVGRIPGDGFGNLTQLVELRMRRNSFNGSIPSQLFQLSNLQVLDLSYNALEGPIPPQLFQLKSLQVLDLSYNALEGVLSQELGYFTQLVELRMSSNSFNGSIPSQLFQLSNLQVLDLSLNTLEGPIPQLFQLKSLRVLDLSHNALEGVLSQELGKLRNLEQLNLEYNVLSGNIPEEIGNLTELKELYLQNNQFSEIPADIGRLPNMEMLELSDNRLTGPIPSSICNLSNVITLQLQHNNLAGDIPTCLFNITELRKLYIGGEGSSLIWNNKAKIVPRCSLQQISMRNCGISGKIPDWISSQTDLAVLDLSMNQLEGRLPDWFVEMDIPGIVLSDNKLTGSLPSRLFDSPFIQILALARNDFSGELPNNVGNASRMAGLVLSGNRFSGKIPMSMSNMSNLQVLDLSINKFSGNSFPHFRESPLFRGSSYFDFSVNDFFGKVPMGFPTSTRVLSLGGNRFYGDLPSNFSNLVNLQSLDLHENHITGNFQDVFPQIPALQVLNLRKNSLEGFIPRTISNLCFLRILDLSGNNLTGSFPQELANLKGMIETPNTTYNPFNIGGDMNFSDKYRDDIEFHDLIVNWKSSFQALPTHNLGLYSFLDLSDNKLSGEIPASLGNLKGLKVLNISHNNISGHIPMSFGNLTHIESLDLSHNKITGSIPQSLAKLEELSTLDVSNNRLTGKIPMGNQMNTMDEPKSYANNSGLCGMQMKVTCPEDIPRTPTEGTKDEEEDKILSLVFWEGTWVGFPVGLFSSILIIGNFLNFLQLFKFW